MRNKKLTILTAAAAMALGGIGFYSSVRADDPAVTPPADRAADTTAGRPQSPAANEVRETISQATSAAVQGKFKDLEERFTSADRKRLGDEFKDNTNLRDRFTQFNTDWKAKYNENFDSANIRKALTDSTIQIYQGDYTDRARTASERMNPDNTRSDKTGSNTDINKPGSGNAGNQQSPENTSGAFSKDNQTRGQATGEARAGDTAVTTTGDKDLATFYFASSHNLSPAAVVLRKDTGIGNTWKIDVADSLSAQQLSDSISQHVMMIEDQKGDWPADVNDAYRMVTHHVLTGLSDMGGMNRPGDRTGQPNPNQP